LNAALVDAAANRSTVRDSAFPMELRVTLATDKTQQKQWS
jgi:hypothetical protein